MVNNFHHGTSLSGYYNASGELLLAGTANGSTAYYQLIQKGVIDESYNTNTTYYYMVTRDTNIVHLTGNISNSWATGQNKPFTFTGLNNGIDNSATYTWTVSGTYVTAYNDTAIENLRIASTQSTTVSSTTPAPATTATTNRYLYGNYKNLKVGRGITSPANTCAFYGVIGGTAGGTGTSSNLTKYNTIVESGTYIFIMLTNTTGTAATYVDMYATYGSDFDRMTANNANLEIRFVASRLMGRKYLFSE